MRRLLPRSLFGRALLIIVTPLILVQLIAAYVFFDRVWELVTRRLSAALAGDVAIIARMLERGTGAADRGWVFDTAWSTMGIRATLAPGEKLSQPPTRTGSGLLERQLIRALDERVQRPYLLDVWSQPRDVLIDVELADGVLQVRTTRERLFTSNIYVFLLWMVGSSIILFAVASVFMRNQVRPIRRLAEVADEFGKGRDVPDFKPAGAAEVRQAAAAFVVMRERIRRHITQRTEMLAGVSHDLRTPLTRMKLELAMLGEGPAIAGLKTDVADMERMVDSYLAFVRGEGEETVQPIDLGALLAELVGATRRNGHAVGFEGCGTLIVQLRPQAAKRALSNLIDNATRHANRVEIAAERKGSFVEILIDDDGPGVPPGEREEVFKPFSRLERSRNPTTGGVGLGLTIARDVARAHGGDIVLDDAPLGGLRAKVRLPT